MSVATGDSVSIVFTTHNPSTGAAADADNLPTGVLYVDGVSDAATVEITDLTGTGKYKMSVTIPTVTTGQHIDVVVDATIAGVACSGVVWQDQAGTAGVVIFSEGATLDDLLDELAGTHGDGSWEGGGAGVGTGSYTDTITDDDSNPLDGVRVQLSTDSAGTNVVYEGYTSSLGVFTLRPDPGTYYRWLDLAGYTFTQGVEVEVS